MSESKRDWFFCLILAVITLLAYQPAWHGGLLWDDDAHVGAPELRTLDGLRRIWLVPRTTQQFYPVLHTSFWLQQRLLGDSTTFQMLVALSENGILVRICWSPVAKFTYHKYCSSSFTAA